MTAAAKSPSAPHSLANWRTWMKIVERGFALAGVGTVVFFCTLNISAVVSPSMHPTLQGTSWFDGDRVLTEKVSYWFRTPHRWEVVTYRRDDGTLIMKRVVGLPGETISMLRDGRLYVDGELAPQPPYLEQIKYLPTAALFEEKKVDCGDGYFVLGDYSRDSDDSRYNGPISKRSIVGRPWLIVQPWSRLGWVR